MLKIFSLLLLIIFITATSSCGGSKSGVDSVLIPDDITLDTLSIEGYELDFDKDRTGPYEIDVASDVDTLQFRATITREATLLYYQLTNSKDVIAQTEISSGEAVDIELEEGSNLLKITAIDEATLVLITYTVLINKTSAAAHLSVLQVFATSGELELSPNFNPDTYSYITSVPYDDCSYALKFISEHKDNKVSVENTSVANSEFFYGNLEPGENHVDVFVTSSDGIRNERYSVTVERTLPTETQINKNARLKKLIIEDRELDFYCSQKLYAVEVNSNTESLVIQITSEIDGIAMFHEDTDLENNEAIEIALETGNSIIEIVTHSLDSSITETYQIYVNRLTTNRIYVDDVAELQHALKNAEPNDDIRIKPGIYSGIADIANSGSTEAAFFSERSGTALLPIYLSADDADEDTVLQAEDTTGDILHLHGSHWLVSGFSLSSGNRGIVLNQADSIRLNTLTIENVQESGIEFLASNNNSIRNSEISLNTNDTSTTPQAESPPALIRIDATTSSSSSSNEISRNILHSSANHQAIYLSALASDTLVQSNRIQTSKNENASNPLPMIIANGSQTTLRYNSFYPDTLNNRAISANGDSAYVYQNVIERDFAELPLVFSDSGLNIFVAENFLTWASHDEDEHDAASYGGSNVSPMASLSPHYRIRLADTSDNCLGLTADTENDDFFYVQVQPCGDGTNFQWRFEFSSDRYVYIKNVSVDEGYLMPVPTFTEACNSIESASSITYLTDNVSGYAQQWAIYKDGETYWFANKFNTAYALTVGGSTYTAGTAVVACPWVASKRQRFILENIN